MFAVDSPKRTPFLLWHFTLSSQRPLRREWESGRIWYVALSLEKLNWPFLPAHLKVLDGNSLVVQRLRLTLFTAETPGFISSPLVWELRSHKPSSLFKGKKRMLYVEPRGTIVGWPFHPGWFQPAFRLSKPTHLLLSCKILVPFCDAVTTNFIVMIWILIITAIDLE